MRRRSPGSVLHDLQRGLSLIQRQIPVDSGVGGVNSPNIGAQTILGGHYAETRNVIPFSFDDSIDPTHSLDCFFQMPAGVLKIYSAKLWVKPDAFRAYETGSTGGGGVTSSSSGGGQSISSGAGASHQHLIFVNAANTDGAAPATDAQGVHTHLDGDGVTTTGASASHSHNVGSHTHGYSVPQGVTSNETGHTHAVSFGDHTHTTDTTHSHGITYGIFVSAAATGTLSVQLANDGTTFGATLGSGASITALDLKQFLSTTAGDRQLRISTAGAGVLARVKVLLMLDVLLKVDLG